MRPELEERGLAIVTLSTDTPEEIAAGRHRHGLKATMLSGMPGKAKALPVPTSLLVNAKGMVVWMDQSENYQRRSDPDHVRAALRNNFD